MVSSKAIEAFAKLQEEKAPILSSEIKQGILNKAEQRVAGIIERGTIFNEQSVSDVVRFDRTELDIGRLLGTGGFCKVSEISKIKISSNNIQPELHSREFMAMQCIREECGPRYAIKELSAKTKAKEDDFLKGIADIVLEARILAVIQHDNIIKIRGFANCDYFDEGFFIVMDRLQITLDRQIVLWREASSTCSTAMCFSRKKRKEHAEDIMDEKLAAGIAISGAVAFLHENNIIYRDLKPDNIGFDIRGNVKIFDFGLATEVNRSKSLEDGTYNLTGYTGSPLYMAPEVAKRQPYNFSADAYSFGILLWQIMAMKRPFEKLTNNALRDYVVNGTYRPPLDQNWSDNLAGLMQICWTSQFNKRPSFDVIQTRLRTEGFDDGPTNILDVSTRSYTNIMSKVRNMA